MGLIITGQTASAAGGSGPAAFLDTSLTLIRRYADEPSTNAKYSDSNVYDEIAMAFSKVWQSITRNTRHPAVVSYDVTVTVDTEVYVLPPTLSRILDMAWVDATTNEVTEWIRPSERLAPTYPHITFEGNIIRFMHNQGPIANFTLRLWAKPTGWVALHRGAPTSITNDTSSNNCAIVLPATPTIGTLDHRPNAYAGCIFRLLTASDDGAGIVQDRVITAYDASTRTLTVEPAYATATLPTTPATYEITPLAGDDLLEPISLLVARKLVMAEGDDDRSARLDLLYKEAILETRLRESHYETILGSHFRVDVLRSKNRTGSMFHRLDHRGR